MARYLRKTGTILPRISDTDMFANRITDLFKQRGTIIRLRRGIRYLLLENLRLHDSCFLACSYFFRIF